MAAALATIAGLPAEQLALLCGGGAAFTALFVSFGLWHVYDMRSLRKGGL